ncbi:MAG: GMC family oxidoreductase N-terminal domain-containing protein [Roseiflexaceae bacterium]
MADVSEGAGVLMQPYTVAEARLARWLNLVALLAAALGLAALVAAWLAPAAFALPLPAAAETVAGLGLVALLARSAAGDVRRFRAMVWLVAAGLALAAIVLLLLALLPGSAFASPALLGAAVLALALAGAVGFSARRSGVQMSPWLPWLTDKGPTTWEIVAGVACVLLGVLGLLVAGALLLLALQSPPWPGDTPLHRLVFGGTVLAYTLLGVCLLVAATRLRRLIELLDLVSSASAIGVIAWATTSATFTAGPSVALFGIGLAGQTLQIGALAAHLVVLLGLLGLKNRISHALLSDLAYFAPLDFRAFEALAESLFVAGASARVPPYQVALRVDGYMGAFRSNRVALARWCVRLWEFLPLLGLRPRLSWLAPAERRAFIDLSFVRDSGQQRPLYRVLNGMRLSIVIDGFDAALRFAMQLAYLGYYGDPLVQRELGYLPFSERPKDFPVVPVRRHPPLRVETPEDLRVRGLDVLSSADVVVIGSGAAGAILAEQLAAQGRDVLLLDKGLYVPPDAFTEDEIDMLSRLYGDGGLQMAESLAFNIVQGSCVGGSTVINNAVCFETPDAVLDRWNDPHGANAGIDRVRYRAAQEAVKQRLLVRSIKDSTVTRAWPDVLNQGDRVVAAGVERLLAHVPHTYDVVRANITDCLGCGYCNIGCKYGRKLSMLDEVLPSIQQKHPDTFRIFSETEVVALRTSGGRVTEIVAQVAGRRPLTIRQPKTVIVSAGAIASSWLLLRSGIGQGELPVGLRFGANVATPLHGLFDEPLFSFHGLQIAHYLELPDHPGFVFESEFNPPISQALLMPGWLDTHERNMRYYQQMTMFGVLVGSDPVAYVSAQGQFGRGAPAVVYTPTDADLDRLVDALTQLGQLMFAGGAKEVLPSTRSYRSYNRPIARYRDPADLAHLKTLVKAERDIILATAHPQGGNALSAQRGRNGTDGGVVDPEFRVYGYDNLYVCDASVFPSPTTVNPQLSVMTFAHYAAELIR